MPDNPLPLSCALLVPALAGLGLGGLTLARKAVRDRTAAAALVPGLAAAAWVLSIHLSGLLTRSFLRGLVIGTLVPAVLGAVAWVSSMRYPGRLGFASGSRSRPSKWMWITAAASTLGIAVPLALSGAWHDEVSPMGHMAIVAELQNGVYPPRFIPFVEHELRYHYGFNILTAAVTGLFRLQIDVALDAVTCAAWFYSWCLLWLVGERMLGRGRSALAPAFTLLGGGAAPFVGWLYREPLTAAFLARLKVDGRLLNAPMVSYFFQHPWSIGLPLGLCFVLLFMDRPPARPRLRYAALGLLLLALALGQFVLFVSLTASAVAATALEGGLTQWRRTLSMLAVAALSLLCASRLHGFFAPIYNVSAGGLLFERGVGMTWLLVSLGLLLPLGVAGLLLAWSRLRPRRLLALLGLMAAGGLLVPSTFRYAYSGDIAKFGTVAGIALSLLACAAVARMLQIRQLLLRGSLVALAIAGVVAPGLLFTGVVLSRVDPKRAKDYYQTPARLSKDDAQALAWLRRHAGAEELVYRAAPAALAYANWGGLAGPWTTSQVLQHGFTARDRDRFRQVFKELPPNVDLYLALRVRWMVLAPSDKQLLRLATQWQSQGRAEVAATFGSLRVVRLLSKR